MRVHFRSRSILYGSASGAILAAAITLTLLRLDPARAEDASAAVAPRSSCASLVNLKLPEVEILSATPVSTGPNYCQVIGVIQKRISTQDPDHFTYGIGFELNLPDSWIGRFELMGGSGTDGSLSAANGTNGTELAAGWAVASNDGGHENSLPNPFGWTDTDATAGGSAHFGIDAKAREDYGYNALEETADVSKQIISFYYDRPAAYSYFWGCSDGGREAILASQQFPGLFDGIVAGNPGLNLPQAALAEAWNEQALAPLATRIDLNGNPYIPDTFQPQDLEVAAAAILSACDGLDGLVDGIIDNYPACTNKRVYPALAAYTCGASGLHGNAPHGGTCLTAGQVDALKKIYGGPTNSKGEPLYSTWHWDAGIWDPPSAPGAGWSLWNVGVQTPPPLANNAINLTLGAGAVPMIFMTPPVVTPASKQAGFLLSFNFDTQAPLIFNKTPDYPMSSMQFMGQASDDLSNFQRQGGKLVVYDSVNDGIFSSTALIEWYKSVNWRMGGDAQRFARLFMVPNMAHCGGGPATSVFGNNVLGAITNWVEKDVAPERIIASNSNTASPFPSGGLFDPRVARNFPTGGTRALCPFPLVSHYNGSGATNVATSFTCVPAPVDEEKSAFIDR